MSLMLALVGGGTTSANGPAVLVPPAPGRTPQPGRVLLTRAPLAAVAAQPLAIDASTPAIAVQSSATTATVTTASFTPPAGSLLLIRYSANTVDPTSPATPTITDNLGVHLTYTLSDFSARADGPAADGQAAIWTAPVGTSAPMTVTVTNQAPSGSRHAALCVTVLTGAAAVPVGAHGKNGSTSAGSIAQAYTAQATGGWGFISVIDWSATGAQTAGTGCTLEGSANVGTPDITYGFLRRTSADDVNTVSNTLNVTLGGTSTNLRWAYVEIVPAALVASNTGPQPLVITGPGKPSTAPPSLLRSTLADPPVLTTSPPLVLAAAGKPLPGAALILRGTLTDPSPPTTPIVLAQPAPPRPSATLTTRSSLADDPVLTTPAPLVVTAPGRPMPGGALVQRGTLADPIVTTGPTVPPIVVSQPAQPKSAPPVAARSTLADDPVLTTPPPLVIAAPGRPIPGAALVLRGSLIDPVVTVGPTVPPIVVSAPATPHVAAPALTRSSLADDPVLTTAAPYVLAAPRSPTPGTVAYFRTPAGQDLTTPPPLLVGAPGKRTSSPPLLMRSAPPDVVIVTAKTPGPLVLTSPGRRTGGVALLTRPAVEAVDHSCSTPRPSTGTTARPGTGTTTYLLATTVRPSSGTTARPDTGQTADPC